MKTESKQLLEAQLRATLDEIPAFKPTMTCRIDRRVIGQDRATLYISGRIAEEDVGIPGTFSELELKR